MFRMLEAGIAGRVLEMLPQMGVGAFENEEERMKRESARAQQSVSARTTVGGTAPAPIRSEGKPARNDLVTITNGVETKEMKFKKAEPLLEAGWRIV